MTIYRRSFLIVRILILTLISFLSKGQIVIDLPVNNSVFQRNSSNLATINIAGDYTCGVISSVQARLVTPGTNSPISGFDWSIIDVNPSKGQFYGSLINVPAGWYTLQIRSVKSGTVVQSSSVNRVGVGDVFLAFGQSNAQGFPGISGLPVSSEKVITHNYIDSCSFEVPDFPSLNKIEADSSIGQHGIGSWYWGKLGDNLTGTTGSSTFGLPVAFFNGATGGASVENFVQSSSGSPTIHPFTGDQFCEGINPDDTTGVGTPYITFLKTIRYYNSLYGIRAILWMQGESDNYLNTSQIEYKNTLNQLIDSSRVHFGETIPWVVSRTSWYGSDSASANVINAQNNVITSGTQVFQGPFTDDLHNGIIAGSRDENNVHFQGAGLIETANRWYNSLNDNLYSGQNFFQVSAPIKSNPIPEMSYSISGSNVTVTAPGGYSSYRWVTTNNYESTPVSTAQFLIASGSNVYRCFMTKANGQIVMSQKVDIEKITSQQTIPSSCSGTVYLSDYTPYSLQNDPSNGPIAFDQSNGGALDGDGTPLMINGSVYSKGLGVYGSSEIVYKVTPGLYTNLRASIGVDDDISTGGSVIFKVYGDNNLLYSSSTLSSSNNAVEINVPLCSYSTIKLVTENAGDGPANDMADWGDIRFTCEGLGNPTSISVNKIGSKCIGINWSAPSTGTPVEYELLVNGSPVDTVNSGVFTYLFGGLNSSTSYTLGVKSIGCSGNKSGMSGISQTTNGRIISYSPNFNFICIGDSVTPILDNPGGIFNIISGAGQIDYLNTANGEIVLNGSGPVTLSYVIDKGTVCYDSSNVTIYGQIKPSTPVISANINLLNTKDTLILTSNTNCSPYSLVWSNDSTSTSFKVKLADTTSFYARCKNSFCFSNSSNIIQAKVIPDCPNAFTLNSTASDLNYGAESFDFFAGDTISAANKVFSSTEAIFKAGKNIQLTPGFEARAGSVFSATILGCP